MNRNTIKYEGAVRSRQIILIVVKKRESCSSERGE